MATTDVIIGEISIDALYPSKPKSKKTKKRIFKSAINNADKNPKKEYNLILSHPLI